MVIAILTTRHSISSGVTGTVVTVASPLVVPLKTAFSNVGQTLKVSDV